MVSIGISRRGFILLAYCQLSGYLQCFSLDDSMSGSPSSQVSGPVAVGGQTVTLPSENSSHRLLNLLWKWIAAVAFIGG